MKILSALLLALFVLLGAGLRGASPQTSAAVEARQPVTVIFVRHAEKDTSSATNRDPGLTEEGAARAEALARLVGKAGVTHLFASEFTRTKATLAPLAKGLSLDVKEIPAQQGGRMLAALRALPPGAVAVVAGHSNTVPALVEGLGGEIEGLVDTPPYGEILADDEYDRLFLVTLPAGKETTVKTIELRYGH